MAMALALVCSTFFLGVGCGGGPSDTPPSLIETPQNPRALVMTPSCGNVGSFVLLGVRGYARTQELGDKAVFTGGGVATGSQRTYNAREDRWTLSVSVPPGTVTGHVNVPSPDGEMLDMGVFTVDCSKVTPPDAGNEGGADDVPVSGSVILQTTAPGSLGGKTVAVTPGAASAAEVEAEARYLAKPTNIPPGTCGTLKFPDTDKTLGRDLGAGIELLDGSLSLLSMKKDGSYLHYSGAGSAAALPYEKPLGIKFETPGGLQTNVIDFPPDVTFTSPARAGTPSTITRGMPFTFTFPPVMKAIDGLWAYFPADNKACVFDHSSGSLTMPGDVTQSLFKPPSGLYDVLIYATTVKKTKVDALGVQTGILGVGLAGAKYGVSIE